MTPIARLPLIRRAVAASPLIFEFSVILSTKKAEKRHTGMLTKRGAALKAYAIASEAKPTCDSPSPIIENLFKTRLTPRRAAHNETKIPTMSAR